MRITERGEDFVDVIYTYTKTKTPIRYDTDGSPNYSPNDELMADMVFEKWEKEEARLKRLIKLREKAKKTRRKPRIKFRKKSRKKSLSRQSSSSRMSDHNTGTMKGRSKKNKSKKSKKSKK